jgi:hypothetical protein
MRARLNDRYSEWEQGFEVLLTNVMAPTLDEEAGSSRGGRLSFLSSMLSIKVRQGRDIPGAGSSAEEGACMAVSMSGVGSREFKRLHPAPLLPKVRSGTGAGTSGSRGTSPPPGAPVTSGRQVPSFP